MLSNATVFLLGFVTVIAVLAGPKESVFSLSGTCPASFEKNRDGKCKLRTLYELYNSPAGFGGLRVPLPNVRDGFSPEAIDLGRYLFFDPILSGDKTISCASCHHPDYGLADGRALSIGKGGEGVGPKRTGGVNLPRSAPSLWNVGFFQIFFWDGRASSLEEQARGPLFSPDEMNNTPENLERTLSENMEYSRLFSQVFGLDGEQGIRTEHVVHALVAFQSSLISLNSRYDRYAHGDNTALDKQELRGLNVFRSFVTRCSQCHTPPLFTNNEIAVIGTPNSVAAGFDPGVGGLIADPALRGAFKIPSLRNIGRTSPYMHAGQFRNLQEVTDFYNDKRGHAVPADQDLLIHWHIALREPSISEQDSIDLIAFLHSLTDESLLPQIPAAVPSGVSVIRTAKTNNLKGE